MGWHFPAACQRLSVLCHVVRLTGIYLNGGRSTCARGDDEAGGSLEGQVMKKTVGAASSRRLDASALHAGGSHAHLRLVGWGSGELLGVS